MERPSYPSGGAAARAVGRRPVDRRVPAVLCAVVASLALACRKDRDAGAGSDTPGRLRVIAANLDEAYADASLPPLTEPASLADRVRRWDDFRSCGVRTYVARRRDVERLLQEGIPRRVRHASVGDEAVEECAVQMAIAKKDRTICTRLAADYAGPNGEIPLGAARCWDTRARVFGLPDECPVVQVGNGAWGRNPECLAVARRDFSLCPFADAPSRCRALLNNDPAACGHQDAANDCVAATTYWRGLIPSGTGAPLVDASHFNDRPLQVSFDLRWPQGEHMHVRVQGPLPATAVSWPGDTVHTRPAQPPDRLWGFPPVEDMVVVAWRSGAPAIHLAFRPGGAIRGARQLRAAGPGAPAVFSAVWTDQPGAPLRCQSEADSQGEVVFAANADTPGTLVDGEVKDARMTCSDGSTVTVSGRFRAMILDRR